MEKPVGFNNPDNHELRGIRHIPEMGVDVKPEGIVILASGMGQRSYAHRLYVSLAREFCRAGYQVLRFDFHGLGESEGELAQSPYVDKYNEIQNGLFVEDTAAAADYLKQAAGVKSITVLGICGGAITAMIAMARHPEKMQAGILIGLPVTIDQADRAYEAEITTAQANLTLMEYLPKLFSLRAWSRLLTFQSDSGVIIRSVFVALKSRVAKLFGAGSVDWTQIVNHPAFNPHVIPSFIACLKQQQKLLLVFSEADRLRWEFEAEFQEKCLKPGDKFYEFNKVVVIPEANHEFQFAPSKRLLQQAISDWLASGN